MLTILLQKIKKKKNRQQTFEKPTPKPHKTNTPDKLKCKQFKK